jgi:hypothetical protein
MPLVKCSDGFSMRTPCGMNVMCNSNGERQIKFKLHKKKCLAFIYLFIFDRSKYCLRYNTKP